MTGLPSQLGNYQLMRLVARGGMADIYLARERGLDRTVAVKVLSSARAGDAESAALFVDEARVVGMLSHSNLAAIHEVAEDAGIYYLAMEYVDGADVRQLLSAAQRARVAVPYAAAVAIIMAAAAGLDHAHRRCGPDGRPLYLVHRDVSPSNIMVSHDGAVKMIDFGIARSQLSSHHTNPGIVRGKPSYMAPEQCVGDPVDLRADIFALGVVLYELTTGRRCFNGATDFERMLAVVQGAYTPASEACADFPPALDQVIRTALAVDPAKRFASCAAMIDALEQACAAECWSTSTAAIAHLMTRLFGGAAVEMPRQPALVGARPACSRPVARGTGSAVGDDDDALTRGRRSLPRMPIRSPLAA